LWISRFGSNLRSLFETTSVLHLGWLALPLVIGSIALWGRRRAIGVALVAGTGFSGMTLQIVLMLSFQALHGYIYHQVGLLVTAFMGGLALGAGLASWWRPSSNNRWLTTMQGGLMMAGLGFAMLVPRGVPVPQFTFPLFAMIAGTLTGVVFPLAALLSAPSDAHKADRGTSDSSLVAGLLYGADLLGGSIGAICTSILLVPVLGVVQTCLVVALVAGTGVIISLYPSFSG
jgi:spermidine synthase